MSSDKPVLPKVRKKNKVQQPRNTAKSLLILGFLTLGVFLLISMGIGWLTSEQLTSEELYARTLDGRRESRAMAAVEWARQLEMRESQGRESDEIKPAVLETRMLCDVLTSIVNQPNHVMKTQQAYHGAVALVMGFSRLPRVANDCLETLVVNEKASGQLVVQGQLSLARLQQTVGDKWLSDASSKLESSIPSIRKATVFSLGRRLKSPEQAGESLEKMKGLLFDSEVDVRWNTAMALGAWGLSDGRPVFAELLSWAEKIGANGQFEGDSGALPEVLTEPMVALLGQVFGQVVNLQLDGLVERVQEIAKSHPHVQVRLAAMEVLQRD